MRAKKIVVTGVLIIVAAVVVDLLGDLTQTRPDHVPPGAATEVVYQVVLRDEDDRRPMLQWAQGLWGACQGTIERRTGPMDVTVSGHTARVVVAPSLGTHARTRLRGCLEDATLDRMRGDVVAMRLVRSR